MNRWCPARTTLPQLFPAKLKTIMWFHDMTNWKIRRDPTPLSCLLSDFARFYSHTRVYVYNINDLANIRFRSPRPIPPLSNTIHSSPSPLKYNDDTLPCKYSWWRSRRRRRAPRSTDPPTGCHSYGSPLQNTSVFIHYIYLTVYIFHAYYGQVIGTVKRRAWFVFVLGTQAALL